MNKETWSTINEVKQEIRQISERLESHISDEEQYREVIIQKLDPILDAINAGKISYVFVLKAIGFIASIGGLILLFRQLFNGNV